MAEAVSTKLSVLPGTNEFAARDSLNTAVEFALNVSANAPIEAAASSAAGISAQPHTADTAKAAGASTLAVRVTREFELNLDADGMIRVMEGELALVMLTAALVDEDAPKELLTVRVKRSVFAAWRATMSAAMLTVRWGGGCILAGQLTPKNGVYWRSGDVLG